MDILEVLRHHDNLPRLLREIEDHKNTLSQNLARAADEIETLRKRDSIMVDALSEILATAEGKSNQPVLKIVEGCVKELRNIKN